MSAPQQTLPPAPESSAPPPQLAGLTLPRPPLGPTGNPGTKEPTSSPEKVGSQQLLSFISLVHSYLLSTVTLADQKAAFLFAADSAFLGYLMSDGLIRQLRPPPSGWQMTQWSALASLLILGVSIAMAIYVVMPRLGGRSSGLIYFRAIATRKNMELYVAEVVSSADSSLSAALAEHSYELAKISTRKYQHLRIGMWTGALGFLAGLAYIELTR